MTEAQSYCCNFPLLQMDSERAVFWVDHSSDFTLMCSMHHFLCREDFPALTVATPQFNLGKWGKSVSEPYWRCNLLSPAAHFVILVWYCWGFHKKHTKNQGYPKKSDQSKYFWHINKPTHAVFKSLSLFSFPQWTQKVRLQWLMSHMHPGSMPGSKFLHPSLISCWLFHTVFPLRSPLWNRILWCLRLLNHGFLQCFICASLNIHAICAGAFLAF